MAQGPQTFAEGLQTLASDAMRLATMPDADPVTSAVRPEKNHSSPTCATLRAAVSWCETKEAM